MPCTDDFCVDEEQTVAGEAAVAKLYHETASARLVDQLSVSDTTQQRIAGLMTIGSIVLPLTAGVLTSDSVELENDKGQAVALTLAVIAYVGLAVFFYLASRLSKWDTRPDMEQWNEIVTPDRSEAELRWWLGNAYVEAFMTNRRQLDRKGKWVAFGAVCLTVEVLCLSAAVLIPLASRWG